MDSLRLLVLCICVQQSLGKYVNVGNHPCPSATALTDSPAHCANAAEALVPKGGCYGRSWADIVRTVKDRSLPRGCFMEAAAGGGCALIFNPTGNATSVCSGQDQVCQVLCSAPAPKGPSTCAAHSKCAKAKLEGDCCPNKDGKFLDCCDAECSKHSKCSHLQGYCCPDAAGQMLDCCKGNVGEPSSVPEFMKSDPTQCSAHSQCAKLKLEGACCPDKEGKFLDCCDSECAKHSKCSHLKGECCPTTDGKMLECCKGDAGKLVV